MKLHLKSFAQFIKNNTTASTRKRYSDSEILKIKVAENKIDAWVKGTKLYKVNIFYNPAIVSEATCNCSYDHGGYCKHIVNVLMEADKILEAKKRQGILFEEAVIESITKKSRLINLEDNSYKIENQKLIDFTPDLLKDISEKNQNRYTRNDAFYFLNAEFGINSIKATIQNRYTYSVEYKLTIRQRDNDLFMSCSCYRDSNLICEHLNYFIKELMNDKHLRVPFDEKYRHSLLKEKLAEKGINNVENPDELFSFQMEYGRVVIIPKFKLLSLSQDDKEYLKRDLLPQFLLPYKEVSEKQVFIVLEEEYYGEHISFYLMEAPLKKSGGIKSPVDEVDLNEKIKNAESKAEMLFYGAFYNDYLSSEDILNILKNPKNYPFYFHKDNYKSKKIIAKNLSPIQLNIIKPETKINVRESGDFYVLDCTVSIDNKSKKSGNLKMKDSFLKSGDSFYYVNNPTVSRVLEFFQKNGNDIFIHSSQFPEFKDEFLDKLENHVTVSYSFVKPAPKKLIKEKSLDKVTEQLIYLSDEESYILITPVIRYGETEIPVLSRRNLYAENPDGSLYQVERNEHAEHIFLKTLRELHPDFEDQEGMEFFYLHKQKFLDEGWFIEAFEVWRENGYSILGFNQIKDNRYSPYKMTVQTTVQSGIDWFDVHMDVSFGDQKIGLKEIQKSIVNKNRYVVLGDGTHGLLPDEWVQKFGRYFRSGEVKEDAVRTHKSNFQLIDDLFEEEVLSEEVKFEIEAYKEKLANFHSIRNIEVPKKLISKLRDYQKEGLNWLNFLDEFGFGGCLADDMGLGKTVQVLAYLLSQIEKGNKAPNLAVLPTSLLFNWQKEIEKFAPPLKYYVNYGPTRETDKVNFEKYNVILTTYGTLLSDIEVLRKQEFNVVVLDESQAIKNTQSKRYKAVRLLKARQRLVVTGTPVENNTFDLYAQMSFALPGLLGSAKRFADDYSTPIDKFQDEKRAAELQKKINPFLLRRTKQQVAKELPEKTEMVIYCEMGTEQRRVYDTYKAEFQKYLQGASEEELSSSTLHVLQGLTKLRQICNSPALLSDNEFYGDQSAKMDELVEQLTGLTDQHKVLVFSQFVGMLEIIKKRLDKEKIKYAYLTGKTRNREEVVNQFQNDEETRVFLISLKAGGTGLNLTKAEYVFLVDPWWNPAVENQAIDRAHRIGQTNNVVAIRLITPDSIEEKIMELQSRKKKLAEDLIHTDSNILKKLTKEDLMNLV